MNIAPIEKLNDSAEELRRINPDKSLVLASDALKQAMTEKNLIQQAKALHNLGEAHLWKSEFDKAFEFCFGALKIFNSLANASGLASVYYSIGTIFFYIVVR